MVNYIGIADGVRGGYIYRRKHTIDFPIFLLFFDTKIPKIPIFLFFEQPCCWTPCVPLFLAFVPH